MELKGTLNGGRMSGTVSGTGRIRAGLTTPQMIYPGIYSGPTVIIPEHEEQVLNTGNLLLTSNITVKAIPEPEFVQQIYDSGEIALEDTLFNGWTPSTTAKTIKATQNGSTFSGHFDEYEYLLKWETSFQAVYNAGATLKAQVYWEGADQYQVLCKRPNSFANIQADNWNGNVCVTYLTVPFIRYYNTSGSLTYTHSISYGIYPALTAATFASSTADITTVTPKCPTMNARCSSTYFATARAPELDQEESKFRIIGKLYRYKIPGEVRDMYDVFYQRMLDEQI